MIGFNRIKLNDYKRVRDFLLNNSCNSSDRKNS
jgi:hypothetical protein